MHRKKRIDSSRSSGFRAGQTIGWPAMNRSTTRNIPDTNPTTAPTSVSRLIFRYAVRGTVRVIALRAMRA